MTHVFLPYRRTPRLGPGWASGVLFVAVIAYFAGAPDFQPALTASGAPAAERLYVVDSAAYKQESQVLAVDGASGRVTMRFAAGHQPDAIVSADGARLYISSSRWIDRPPSWAHTLETYNTRSGALFATIDTPDRFLGTLDRYGSRMTLSRTGRFIYIFNNRQTPADNFYLAIFETSSNALLKARVDLFGCGDAVVVPSADDYRLQVLCGHEGSLRDVTIDRSGSAVQDTSIRIRDRGPYRPGLILSNPTADGITLLAQDRSESRVDLRSRQVTPDARTVPPAPPRSGTTEPDRWIRTQKAQRNGAPVFIASGSNKVRKAGSNLVDRIEKLNADTLRVEATLNVTTPFYAMTMGTDGRTLYAVAPDAASILVIDAVTLKEARRIQLDAETPMMVIAGR